MILMRAPKPYVHQEYPKWVDGVIVDSPSGMAEDETPIAEPAHVPCFATVDVLVRDEEDNDLPPPVVDLNAPRFQGGPTDAKRKGGWPAGKPRKPREA